MKWKKRLGSILLVLALLAGMLGDTGLSVHAETTYQITTRQCYITYAKVNDEMWDISGFTGPNHSYASATKTGMTLKNIPAGAKVELGVANYDSTTGSAGSKVLPDTFSLSNVTDLTVIKGGTAISFTMPSKNISMMLNAPKWTDDPDRNVIRCYVDGIVTPSSAPAGYIDITDESGDGLLTMSSNEENRSLTAYAYMNSYSQYILYDYQFDHWEASGIELTDEQKVSNPMNFNMPVNDINLTAVFKDAGIDVTLEQTNTDAGTAYITNNQFRSESGTSKLKQGTVLYLGVSNLNDAYNLSWKIMKSEVDITDQIQTNDTQTYITVPDSAITIMPVFTSKYMADINVLPNNSTFGTATAKISSGTASANLTAVMPGSVVTLTASPMNRYMLDTWSVTYGDSVIPVTVDEADKNVATFTVPDELSDNIIINVSANFILDPSQISSEREISNIMLRSPDGKEVAAADKSGTAFTIHLPSGTDEEAIDAIISGQYKLEIVASDYSTVKLGEYEEKTAEEWKNGITTALLVDADMLLIVTAEDGSEQSYTLKLEQVKSSEKEIAEVALLDKDTKEELVSGTLDGTAWTLQLPQTLTADEAAQVAYGGSYLKIAASDKASVAQAGGYDDKGQESWGSGNILCYMDLNNAVKFTVTAEDGSTQDYTITIAYTEPDPDKPVLTVGTVNRTSAAEAKITFTSDMAGTYYYRLAESGAAAPEIDTTGAGLNAKKGTNTVSLTTLSAGAKDLYVVVVSNDGAVSDPLKIEIPTYNDYTIELSYPKAGGTLSVSSTSAKAGDIITVTVTPKSGKRLVAGSLRYSESSAGGAVVNIDETTLKFTMPASEISISCTWEDDTSDTPQTTDHPITAFMVSGVSGVINDTTGRITITLPNGTDLTSLSPVIVTADGVKSVSPKSGAAVDLSKAVTYTVTYEDGTTKQYTVNAYTEAPAASDQLWEDMLNGAGGSTDHTGSNTWWEKAKKFKRHNDYPEYWAPVE